MIPKAIDAIEHTDIESLIAHQVREGRTIEYKRLLPSGSDEARREFLADISAFANAAGGDLLFGLTSTDGLPDGVLGLSDDLDAEMLRLESLIRDGVDPRIQGISMRVIEGFSQGPVLIVRVPRSWAGPHMVIFKNLSRFFTRNSAGKYQMDVTEIRSAFLLSEALPERMKRFRDERIGRIIANQEPMPLPDRSRLIMHVLPIVSFTSNPNIAVTELKAHIGELTPVGHSGCSHRLNVDGLVTYSGSRNDDEKDSYCQIFRTGQVEAVYARLVEEKDNSRYIASVAYERYIIEAVSHYLRVLKALDIPCPLMISFAMTGVCGVLMYVGMRYSSTAAAPIDRDMLVLPDVLVEEYASVSNMNAVARTLRPIFDVIWNACGYPRSHNFDAEGNWSPER